MKIYLNRKIHSVIAYFIFSGLVNGAPISALGGKELYDKSDVIVAVRMTRLRLSSYGNNGVLEVVFDDKHIYKGESVESPIKIVEDERILGPDVEKEIPEPQWVLCHLTRVDATRFRRTSSDPRQVSGLDLPQVQSASFQTYLSLVVALIDAETDSTALWYFSGLLSGLDEQGAKDKLESLRTGADIIRSACAYHALLRAGRSDMKKNATMFLNQKRALLPVDIASKLAVLLGMPLE